MRPIALLLIICSCAAFARAAEPAARPAVRPGPGDDRLAHYFKVQVDQIERNSLSDIHTLAGWNAQKQKRRDQLAEMLGLHPMPERTDLKLTITGKIDHPDFTVEKLHYQSRPGLYVTGNLYVPKNLDGKKVPAILYVCGHGNNKKNGISYGSKTYAHPHAAWYARNGYVCLIIDTLQLGEIEGIHHGLYREKQWWWISRGYTPAGVEAWNGIRGIDYLVSRPEVDASKIGVTGRSGGGAYTWWISALDERVAAAVPVAGGTDWRNHVVDGIIEGHCDCMYMVNKYRWDMADVAALVAPRPLLILNTDTDPIFPADGVTRTFVAARKIWKLHDKNNDAGMIVELGGHVDSPQVQTSAFEWFNRHLKGDNKPVTTWTEKVFEPELLKVYAELPKDQINTRIAELFVDAAPAPTIPADRDAWAKMRDAWMAGLRQHVFAGWPAEDADMRARITRGEFSGDSAFSFRLHTIPPTGRPERIIVNVLDDSGWAAFALTNRAASEHDVQVFFCPRGVGDSAFGGDEKKQTQIRRRFWILGQSLEGMQVYDVRRALQATRSIPGHDTLPLTLKSTGRLAGVALYASLFEPVQRLELADLPATHKDGPDLLNVLKVLDIPAALAMAAERSEVELTTPGRVPFTYAVAVAKKLGFNLEVVAP